MQRTSRFQSNPPGSVESFPSRALTVQALSRLAEERHLEPAAWALRGLAQSLQSQPLKIAGFAIHVVTHGIPTHLRRYALDHDN